MRYTKLVLAFVLLTVAVPMLGATTDYLLLIDGIQGESKASVGSDFSCATGRLQFQIKGTPPAAMTRMCQAHETRTSLVLVKVGADGRPTSERQQLENVTFTGCQAGDGSVRTDQFSLTFAKCTTRPSRSDVQPNGTLTGLTPTPTPISTETLTLNGPGATSAGRAILHCRKTGGDAIPAHSGQSVPVLTLELSNGQKWTFYEVKMEDILISSATGQSRPGAAPMQSMTFTFSRMTGPSTGFQDSAR